MSEERQRRSSGWLSWAGRIVGLLASVGWLTVMTASSAYDLAEGDWEEVSAQSMVQGGLIVVIAAAALAGTIVSWWRLRMAGILLVLAAGAMGAHVSLVAGRNHLLAWAASGLPYLIAGGLFFGSWWVTRGARAVASTRLRTPPGRRPSTL